MDFSIPGALSLLTGIASILCWGHWYVAIPIALTIGEKNKGDFKLYMSDYDSNEVRQSATFNIKVQ